MNRTKFAINLRSTLILAVSMILCSCSPDAKTDVRLRSLSPGDAVDGISIKPTAIFGDNNITVNKEDSTQSQVEVLKCVKPPNTIEKVYFSGQADPDSFGCRGSACKFAAYEDAAMYAVAYVFGMKIKREKEGIYILSGNGYIKIEDSKVKETIESTLSLGGKINTLHEECYSKSNGSHIYVLYLLKNDIKFLKQYKDYEAKCDLFKKKYGKIFDDSFLKNNQSIAQFEDINNQLIDFKRIEDIGFKVTKTKKNIVLQCDENAKNKEEKLLNSIRLEIDSIKVGPKTGQPGKHIYRDFDAAETHFIEIKRDEYFGNLYLSVKAKIDHSSIENFPIALTVNERQISPLPSLKSNNANVQAEFEIEISKLYKNRGKKNQEITIKPDKQFLNTLTDRQKKLLQNIEITIPVLLDKVNCKRALKIAGSIRDLRAIKRICGIEIPIKNLEVVLNKIYKYFYDLENGYPEEVPEDSKTTINNLKELSPRMSSYFDSITNKIKKYNENRNDKKPDNLVEHVHENSGIRMKMIRAGILKIAKEGGGHYYLFMPESYYIAETETTLSQFTSQERFDKSRNSKPWTLDEKVYQGETRCIRDRGHNNLWGNINIPGNRPVNCVSLLDAYQFINWMNQTNADNNELEYRLCSGEEWEYAARGGKETIWHCGNKPDCLQGSVQFAENVPHENSRVTDIAGTNGFTPNGYKIYHMAGNLAELVELTPENKLNIYGGYYSSNRNDVKPGSNLLQKSNPSFSPEKDTRAEWIGFRVCGHAKANK
jgi:hypothetical protein